MRRRQSDDDSAGNLSPVANVAGLSRNQKIAIEAQSRPNAALIHETIRAEGENELERKVSALFLSGLAAGLSMGFSLVAEGILHAHLPEAAWTPLVANLGYTIGFVIVVMGRQQLFTENTLKPILPLLHHRDRRTFLRVLRLWSVVLCANIAATLAFAVVIAFAPVFSSELHEAFAAVSREAIGASFGSTFTKAVFAGWLVALMVWLLPAAETARLAVIILITWLVAVGGFSHLIAGSVEAFYMVVTGGATMSAYVYSFFIPTLLGNVVGGVALVAALNFGQVAPEIEDEASESET